MNKPDERLIPVLQAIETAATIAVTHYPTLVDKDFEYVYTEFHKFFKSEVQGGNVPEPESTIVQRDSIIDIIFQLLDDAEEQGHFTHLTNGSFAPAARPITTVEELYVIAFNYLKRSVRLWRKNVGNKGYINGPLADFSVAILGDSGEDGE